MGIESHAAQTVKREGKNTKRLLHLDGEERRNGAAKAIVLVLVLLYRTFRRSTKHYKTQQQHFVVGSLLQRITR